MANIKEILEFPKGLKFSSKTTYGYCFKFSRINSCLINFDLFIIPFEIIVVKSSFKFFYVFFKFKAFRDLIS